MVKCDQGYLCRVCGEEVEDIIDSELYLRFVIGEIDPETLHTQPESHLRCKPLFSQFITDSRFAPLVVVTGDFAKESLDPDFVKIRTDFLNRGYARLWEIMDDELGLAVVDYPLKEVKSKWQ